MMRVSKWTGCLQTFSKCLKLGNREKPVNIRLSAMVSNTHMGVGYTYLTPSTDWTLNCTLSGGTPI